MLTILKNVYFLYWVINILDHKIFKVIFHCSNEKKAEINIHIYHHCNCSIEGFSQIGVEDEDDVDPGTGFNELWKFVELSRDSSTMYKILLLVQRQLIKFWTILMNKSWVLFEQIDCWTQYLRCYDWLEFSENLLYIS